MKKQKERWKELLPYEKWAEVVSIMLSSTAGVLLIMDILREFEKLTVGFDFFPIATGLMALSTFCLTLENWRTKRSVATRYMWMAIFWALYTVWNCYRFYF